MSRTFTALLTTFAMLIAMVTLSATPAAEAQQAAIKRSERVLITTPVEVESPADGASSTARRAPMSTYIFGDSFMSGTGIEVATPGTYAIGPNGVTECKRSTLSFGGQLNEALTNRPYTIPFVLPTPWYPIENFAACGGAVTTDIVSTGQHSLAPQLAQVPPVSANRTGVAVVSIGGNNLGFEPVLTECALTTDCHTMSALPEIVNVQANLAAIGAELSATYSQIVGHRDPGGTMQVFVVGYPQLFGDTTDAACSDPTTGALFTQAEREWMNDLAEDLNTVIETVAASMKRVEYVDIDDIYEGHRICDPVPWINGLYLADIGESFHPNAAGHAAVLPELVAAISARGL